VFSCNLIICLSRAKLTTVGYLAVPHNIAFELYKVAAAMAATIPERQEREPKKRNDNGSYKSEGRKRTEVVNLIRHHIDVC
jgi:hypothetical protein